MTFIALFYELSFKLIKIIAKFGGLNLHTPHCENHGLVPVKQLRQLPMRQVVRHAKGLGQHIPHSIH
jgi:hypothetical protein